MIHLASGLFALVVGAAWGWTANDWQRARKANRMYRAILADLEARAAQRQELIDQLDTYELEPIPQITIHHN